MISNLSVARLYTVIGYLETRELFVNSKSKEEFTKTVLTVVGKSPIESSISKFFDYLFDLHAKTDNPDFIWVNEKGKEFNNLKESSFKLLKKGVKISEIKNMLFPNSTIPEKPDKVRPKHGWINLIRKLIVIIDDEFGGKL